MSIHAGMTMTTTGHVDIIEDEGGGAVWEVCFAIAVLLLATYAYTFVVATSTTIMLRADKRIEAFRNQLEQAEHFMKKQQTRPDLRATVLQHFRHHFETRASDDGSQFLAQLPRYPELNPSTVAPLPATILLRHALPSFSEQRATIAASSRHELEDRRVIVALRRL